MAAAGERVVDTVPDDLVLAPFSVRFSDDLAHVAYRAENGTGKATVVADGRRGPFADRASFAPVVAGPHVAWVARLGDADHVVADGVIGAPVREARDLVYAADGSALAYLARVEDGLQIVVAGEPGPIHRVVKAPALSPDGKRVAYFRDDARGALTLGDLDERSWDLAVGPVFRPDGALVYAGARDGAWELVVDGVATPLAFRPRGAPLVAPDGRTLVFTTRDASGSHVVIGGSVGPGFARVGDVAIAADGESAVAAVSAGGTDRWELAPRVAGQPSDPLAAIASVAISADGAHRAAAVQRAPGAAWRVERDGIAVAEGLDAVTLLRFDPDGALVVGGVRGRDVVVLRRPADGQE
ncbi:MAG: PD40 domain-containing protein [Deltaproteobacteria bacterium]|nr:PD40 domain-containing protein [Deltaproteobacteria bacterium]